MEGKIVVPLDGSPLAETAIPFAMELAKLTGAKLLLLRVCVFSVDLEENYVKEHPGEMMSLAYLEKVRAEVTNSARGLSLDPDRVEVKVCQGKFTYEIPEEAGVEGTGLIVMTTHGLGGFTRLLLGSVTQQVLRNSKIPVIVLRPELVKDQTEITAEPVSFQQTPLTIVVPLDGDPASEAALEPACWLAAKLKAKIKLLQVVSHVQPILLDEPVVEILYSAEDQTEDLRYRREAARHYLNQLKESLEAYWKNISFETEVITGKPAASLVKWSEKTRPTLMAIATHARGGVGHILLGSVADEVMRKSTCPVLMVHINKDYPGWRKATQLTQIVP